MGAPFRTFSRTFHFFILDDQLYFLSIQTTLEILPGVELFSGCPRMLEIPAPPEFGPLMDIFGPEVLYLNGIRAGSLAYSMLGRMPDYYAPEDFWKPQALRKYAGLTDYLNGHGNALTSVSDLAVQKSFPAKSSPVTSPRTPASPPNSSSTVLSSAAV